MIRHATRDDMPALMGLAEQFYCTHGSAHRCGPGARWEACHQDWEDWIASTIDAELGRLLIAEDGGDPVGFLLGLIHPAPWCKALLTGYVSVVWVDPDSRSSGVASGMVDRFEREAKKAGAAQVTGGSSMWFKSKAMGRLLTGRGYRLEEKYYLLRLKEI
jgi:GNAT superfamily N-acetyltransferase